jgi:hypothetical protein
MNDLPPGLRALFQVEALTGYEMLTWGYDEVYRLRHHGPADNEQALHRQSVGRGLLISRGQWRSGLSKRAATRLSVGLTRRAG